MELKHFHSTLNGWEIEEIIKKKVMLYVDVSNLVVYEINYVSVPCENRTKKCKKELGWNSGNQFHSL